MVSIQCPGGRPGSPTSAATRCWWSSASRRTPWPARSAACSRTCAPSPGTARGRCCASTGRLVTRPVRRGHRRGFDLLTWRKKAPGTGLPDIADDQFTTVTFTGGDGKPRGYDLADTDVQITAGSGTRKGRVLELRQVTRRKPVPGGTMRQAHILTTRSRGELPAAAVAFRMSSRWREENYFRYGRAHFALDALDSYKTSPDNMERMVPNPARKTAMAAVTSAAGALQRAGTRHDARLAELKNPAPGTTAVITSKTLNRLAAPVETARRRLTATRDAAN